METWRLIWEWTFVVGSVLFAIMSVWVTVAGWSDVKSLFVALAKSGAADKLKRRSRKR